MYLDMPKKKMKHNYTSELELKSLLIRIKNKRLDIGTLELNNRINKYVKWHTDINAKKYAKPKRRNILKNKIKEKIVQLSERTACDAPSYERFGVIILLMMKNILRKPNFSGYTYKDDFYSDAIHKIIKYLNNFNHKLISERTGTTVNAFAYISQIMHHSIVYIIKKKKTESDKLKKYIAEEHIQNNIPNNYFGWHPENNPAHAANNAKITRLFDIEENTPNLLDEVKKIQEDNPDIFGLIITYPSDLEVSFDEYNEIKLLAKENIIVQREGEE